MFVVAIDGPAGAGKGTVTKSISKKLGLVNIDTGATYRCLTLAMLKQNIKLDEVDKIKELLENIKIDFKNINGEQLVYLNDEDVTKEIRSNEVNAFVSQVSSLEFVREKMVDLQRRLAQGKDVIMEGRDIGTVVFPDADVKIYLDATPEVRAERRQRQNEELGIESNYEDVLASIIARDENDKNKKVGALKQAEDAVYVDVTTGTTEENIQKVIDVIEAKRNSINENEKKKKKNVPKYMRNPFYKRIQHEILRDILWVLYKVVYRIKVVGKENVPKNENFILCGNHVEFFKVPIIVLFTMGRRRVFFMGKSELLKNPILRYLAYVFDMLPVKREKKDLGAMKKSLEVIESGNILGIFPEGTINGIQRKVKVKTGTAYMALRTGCKVLPVGIKTTKTGRVIVNIGKPIDYKEKQVKNPEKELLEETTKEIMDNIIMLTETAK